MFTFYASRTDFYKFRKSTYMYKMSIYVYFLHIFSKKVKNKKIHLITLLL